MLLKKFVTFSLAFSETIFLLDESLSQQTVSSFVALKPLVVLCSTQGRRVVVRTHVRFSETVES